MDKVTKDTIRSLERAFDSWMGKPRKTATIDQGKQQRKLERRRQARDLMRARRRAGRERLEAILEAQKGRCQICDNKGSLFVNYDPKTLEPRAFLCVTCKVGLGAFDDDPALITKALAYLKEFKG